MQLKTRYDIGKIPHGEHPAPQAMRKAWQNLNGEWSIEKTDGKTTLFQGKILVPFSPETLNSGIGGEFRLESGQTLIYKRSFSLTEQQTSGCVALHFGAVDSECEVFIGENKVGAHKGGFTPFTLDITPFVAVGENEIKVVCKDEGTRNSGARGKQSDKRGGIWYTPQSGIWQTVWLEFMPKTYIKNLKITPCAKEKSVRICSDCGGQTQKITVFDGDKEIFTGEYTNEIQIKADFQLWSPENPKLYDIVITSGKDELRSYFGVRSFGQTVDEKGVARLTLNGKPYFFSGVLDQGYWSDGMLTHPNDQAIVDELKMLKDMGFNTVRKHIKLEPMRWYYHCDRLGLIVWQDFVNGGGEYKFTHIAAFPFLGFHHRDNDYKYFARENELGREEFALSVDETLDSLYNCVCIGLWTIFNEGWGQFDSEKWTKYVQEKDNTRIIDAVSGWHDQGEEKTTLKSLHTYYTPLKVPRDSRPVVLSEFGGYSMLCNGHTFSEKEFGYKKFKTQKSLLKALEKLYLKKVKPLINRGLCACIYTQVSDVEDEINGLVTYDREIIKVPVEFMRRINESLTE